MDSAPGRRRDMMAARAVLARLRRDPGLACFVLALLAALLVYAPTLAFGLVNHDDPWLVADNWIVQDASWSSLHTIWFDLDSPRRMVLSPEYLPIRDLSVMADFQLWGRWWPGFHITNLALYLTAIAIWFAALVELGVDRRVVGLALLIWAVQPSHAESVAWITERKGLLAMVWAGACALGYARWRAGRSLAWLGLAVLAAVCAVWSKAHGAFAVGALAGLELVLPARRVRWSRSVVGLAAIALSAALAFAPVLLMAQRAQVFGDSGAAPATRLAMVVGVHGFYLRSAAMTLRNAVSYPLASAGPTVLDLVVGALGLVGLTLVLVRTRQPALRAGAVVWLAGWLPVSHLLVRLQMIIVADRYILFPTLGFALIVAVALGRIGKPRLRQAAIAVIVLAGITRTLDAQTSWRSPTALWSRAVASNPGDGHAWAMYVEAVAAQTSDPAVVADVLARGLAHSRSPRLVAREALAVLPTDRARGIALLREAAAAGEPQAMSNLALLLVESGQAEEALPWARAAARLRPRHASRTLGKVALAIGGGERVQEASQAFAHALAIEPASCVNRLNSGLAAAALGELDAADAWFAQCVDDPQLGGRARAERARVARLREPQR